MAREIDWRRYDDLKARWLAEESWVKAPDGILANLTSGWYRGRGLDNARHCDVAREWGKMKKSLYTELRRLPLLRGGYLSMQATNIALVDIYLQQLEAQLIREYLQNERTPDSMMFVSALAQLWIFGLYELLRTWNQWVSELIAYGEELERYTQGPNGTTARSARIERQNQKLAKASSLVTEDVVYNRSFRQVEDDRSYLEELRWARDAIRPVFDDLEALRVTLAKHEVPKTHKHKEFPEGPLRPLMPGYARIDMTTGSLCWFIVLKDGDSKVISRQGIVDSLMALARGHPKAKRKKS